ncbi:MAG: hypothetical protein K2Q20_02750, partial [Phycisphaerales bacterium]|nr:hypothetical protein [Phycisphaerales bacterium]
MAIRRGSWRCQGFPVLAGLLLAVSGGPALAAPPPNDSCATAGGTANPLLPVLQLGVSVAGTTVDATNDPNNFHNATGSCDNTYFDVFYAFTPATTGAYTFKVCAADATYLPNLAVYETSVDVVTSDVVIGCFNQSYTISGCPEDVADCTRGRQVVSYLNAGLTYYIAVGSPTRTGTSIRGAFTIVASAGGGSGTCQFAGDPDTCFLASRRGCEDAYGGVYGGDGTTCSVPPPTPRDDCSQADALVIGQTATGTNAFATAFQDGVSTLLGRKDVFMSFTPTST